MKRRVIIFCGLSGSGKTTLATDISQRLNIVCLHKDAIKERLYEHLNGSSLEESKLFGRVAIELLMALGEDMLRNEVDVILESPFNHSDNPRTFARWIEQYQANVSVIICSVNEDERVRRMKQRTRHESHHEADRLLMATVSGSEFDYSQMPGKKLFLDTTLPLEALVETTLRFLRAAE